MPDEVEALRRENESLRERLAKAEAEASRSRAAVKELMDTIFPYVPPTDEELREIMRADEGESLEEIVAGYRRELEASK